MNKLLCIILLIIVSLVCFVGCFNTSDNNGIRFKVEVLSSCRNTMLYPTDGWEARRIIKSKEELLGLNSEFDISNYITKYDDAYFANIVLIVCLFEYGHLGASLCIKSVQKNDGRIKVNLLESQKKG